MPESSAPSGAAAEMTVADTAGLGRELAGELPLGKPRVPSDDPLTQKGEP
jgi:hypothetical protein